MNCRRVDSILSAYLDGELSGEEMILLRRHLDSCPSCQKDLEAEKQVRRLIGSLPDVPVPAGLEDRISSALFVPSPSVFAWKKVGVYGAVAAAAAASALLAFHMTSDRPGSIMAEEPRFSRSSDLAFTDGRDAMGVYVPLVPVSHQAPGSDP